MQRFVMLSSANNIESNLHLRIIILTFKLLVFSLNVGVSTFQQPESSAKVARSSSMKKPFVKLLRQVVGKDVEGLAFYLNNIDRFLPLKTFLTTYLGI